MALQPDTDRRRRGNAYGNCIRAVDWRGSEHRPSTGSSRACRPLPEQARQREAPGCRDVSGPANSGARGASSTTLPRYMRRDPIGHVIDDRKIMTDEEQRQSELGLKVLQQIDDLRLDRDIERRNGFVADDPDRVRRLGPGQCRCAAFAHRKTHAENGPMHPSADGRYRGGAIRPSRSAAFLASPKFRIGSARMSRTRILGSRLENGS